MIPRTSKRNHPAGGYVAGVGFRIDWQDGPLGRGEDRQEPNGAYVTDVLLACLERMRFYQGESEDGTGRFRCRENALIITKVEEAIHWGNHRTAERERRGVDGRFVKQVGHRRCSGFRRDPRRVPSSRRGSRHGFRHKPGSAAARKWRESVATHNSAGESSWQSNL